MTVIPQYKIYMLGESAITIDFGNKISLELNKLVINLSKSIEELPFKGFIECVPAYSSLTIFYDVVTVSKHFSGFSNSSQVITKILEHKLKSLSNSTEQSCRKIEIPVSFDKKSALDLDFVAKSNNLNPREVIDIFLDKTYRVYMLGFLPGFAYMGELDKRIATPRKEKPRTKVPTGSVGIAGIQTGIYPLESPGGWQIIGKTEIDLFTPNETSPTFLQTGDLVKFIEIK